MSWKDVPMGFGLPERGPRDVVEARALNLWLCVIAGLLGVAVMMQCAVVVIIDLLIAPSHAGRALGFVVAGLAPAGAALGSWRMGAREPDRTLRTFRTTAVTLMVEAGAITWLAGQGWHVLDAQWVHWL
jgi:hypothetical protein